MYTEFHGNVSINCCYLHQDAKKSYSEILNNHLQAYEK